MTGGAARRSLLELLAVSALLIAARLSFDLMLVVGFVYRGTALDQPFVAFGIIGISLLCVLALAIARLRQGRFLQAVAIVGICFVPFAIPISISGPYWKFLANRSEYLAAINSETSKPPLFRVFDWGNENIPLGGVVYRAIVYDESGEIVRTPELRSAEWGERRSDLPPQLRWIAADESADPTCKRYTADFGGHFYYVGEAC